MTSSEIIKTVKNEYIEMLVDNKVPTEGVSISLKKDFKTACWYFDKKCEKHIIYIGEQILENKSKVGKLGIEYYLNSYLHHEMAHALNTTRNHKNLKKWLKDNKVPFSLYNLFEDARIECIYRVENERSFFWTDYEDIPKINKDSNATQMLFTYIQLEGKHRSRLVKMKRVREYYEKITDCKTSEDLMPIMIEWLKEFPESKKDLDDLKSQGLLSDDLESNDELEEGSTISKIMAENTEEIAGEKSPYTDEDSERFDDVSEENIDYDYTTHCTNCIYAEGRTFKFHKEIAERLLPVMERIFKSKTKKVCQSDATNRVSVRNFINKRFDKLYKKKKVESKGKKKINLVIDCSGSMEGSPIINARTIIYMMSCFARKKLVEGKVILTGADASRHQLMTFNLPLNDNEISSIFADGYAEALADTIHRTKTLLKKADYNFCITDGCITDNPISNTNQLNLIGIYVGHPDAQNLSKWFDMFFQRETLEELVQKIAIRL